MINNLLKHVRYNKSLKYIYTYTFKSYVWNNCVKIIFHKIKKHILGYNNYEHYNVSLKNKKVLLSLRNKSF